jgi:RNA polymerase sigma factor for flagellar operon FliA
MEWILLYIHKPPVREPLARIRAVSIARELTGLIAMNSVATRRSVSKQDLDALLTRYAPLVKRIAYHLGGRLPASIHPSDLMQAGMIGLLDAARNFDARHGASFETYAGIRIRGAMLDEVRRSDWAPRSIHRRAREMAQAVVKVEHAQGRHAKDHEIAEALGITLNEYHETLRDISEHRVLSFEELALKEDATSEPVLEYEGDPQYRLQANEIRQAVSKEIAKLPEREKFVLALYYHDELNLREIGEVLGVTESRVCQIHSQALIRLKARLIEKSESGQFDRLSVVTA